MARGVFRVEQGLQIQFENGGPLDNAAVLTGTGAPLGTSGPTAEDARVGSLYIQRDGGSQAPLWQKIADTNAASDWIRITDESVYTALGISYGDLDMGTYTGNIISDNVDQSVVNQELESAIEAISGGSFESVNIVAATPTVVSTCLVDSCHAVEWEVVVYEQANPDDKEYFKHTALHNGTASADATSFDEATHSKLSVLALYTDIAGLTFTSKLEGAAAAQTLGLEISATNAITVKVRRTDIPN